MRVFQFLPVVLLMAMKLAASMGWSAENAKDMATSRAQETQRTSPFSASAEEKCESPVSCA